MLCTFLNKLALNNGENRQNATKPNYVLECEKDTAIVCNMSRQCHEYFVDAVSTCLYVSTVPKQDKTWTCTVSAMSAL
jgi:hypothetical protein